MCWQSETKLYNGSDKDVSASGGKLTKKESLKVKDLNLAPLEKHSSVRFASWCLNLWFGATFITSCLIYLHIQKVPFRLHWTWFIFASSWADVRLSASPTGAEKKLQRGEEEGHQGAAQHHHRPLGHRHGRLAEGGIVNKEFKKDFICSVEINVRSLLTT